MSFGLEAPESACEGEGFLAFLLCKPLCPYINTFHKYLIECDCIERSFNYKKLGYIHLIISPSIISYQNFPYLVLGSSFAYLLTPIVESLTINE